MSVTAPLIGVAHLLPTGGSTPRRSQDCWFTTSTANNCGIDDNKELLQMLLPQCCEYFQSHYHMSNVQTYPFCCLPVTNLAGCRVRAADSATATQTTSSNSQCTTSPINRAQGQLQTQHMPATAAEQATLYHDRHRCTFEHKTHTGYACWPFTIGLQQ